MNPASFRRRYYLLPFSGVLFIIFSVCSLPLSAQHPPANKDTTSPKILEKGMKDIDAAIDELNKGIGTLNEEIDKTDWSHVQTELNESIKKLDADKIKKEVDKALKDIDVDKLKASVNQAVASIDWEKIKANIAEVKDIQIPKLEAQLNEVKPQIEKSMREARKGIEKAKAEMKAYKGFIEDLDKDGLIDKNNNYTIEIKKDRFLINGKTQPDTVYNKYRHFLESHKNVTIKKDKNFTITDNEKEE